MSDVQNNGRRLGGRSGKGFLPGRSGNPGGRPAGLREVQELARHRTAEAVETLTEVMTDPATPPAARVSAAVALLDRGWGKPVQAIEAEAGGPVLLLWGDGST